MHGRTPAKDRSLWGAVPRTLAPARSLPRCQARVGDTGRRRGRARRPSPRTTLRVCRHRSLRLRQRRVRLWRARTSPPSRQPYVRLCRLPLPSQPRMSRTRLRQARHAWLRRERRRHLRRVSTSRTNRHRNVRLSPKNRFTLLLTLARVLTSRRKARMSTTPHSRVTMSVPVPKFRADQWTRGRHLAQRQRPRVLANVLML